MGNDNEVVSSETTGPQGVAYPWKTSRPSATTGGSSRGRGCLQRSTSCGTSGRGRGRPTSASALNRGSPALATVPVSSDSADVDVTVAAKQSRGEKQVVPTVRMELAQPA